MKYRKKPVEIEAIKWTGDNLNEILEFCGVKKAEMDIKGTLIIHTLEGDHIARKGDMIIKGVAGEFYPCKPDIFEATYYEV